MNVRRLTQSLSVLEVRARRRHARRAHDRSVAAGIHGAWVAYASLAPTSTAFAAVRPRPGATPSVNLLLPDLTGTSVFAGTRTAILAAEGLATRLGFRLRIISFGAPPSRSAARAATSVLETALDGTEVVSGWQLGSCDVSTSDVWLATYWTTAHALDVASRNGVVSADRVVYLVQDYEPSFYAASTESVLARSTYHAGFRLLVNSRPLANVLEVEEGMRTDVLVFRPHIDTDGARAAAAQRVSTDRIRVAFYGRPSKPRNSYRLGLASLRLTIALLEEQLLNRVEFVSVGEAHAPVDLGRGKTLTSLGKLPWSKYFDFLATSQVMFSLQQTPHPSHLPLDAVASGGVAVINDVLRSRSEMSPRLHSTDGGPDALAATLASAIAEATHYVSSGYDEEFVARLGEPLVDVLNVLAGRLQGDGRLS